MKNVHVPQEVHDERAGGMVEQFLRRAGLLDAALAHHHDLVGDLERLFLIVRDEDRRHAHLVVKTPQPLPQLLAHLGVEGAEGLVEQQHLGLGGQGAGQGDALPLTAGQLRRQAVAQAFQSNQVQQLLDAVADRRLLANRGS